MIPNYAYILYQCAMNRLALRLAVIQMDMTTRAAAATRRRNFIEAARIEQQAQQDAQQARDEFIAALRLKG